jgi:hypothetical protein
MMGSSTPLAFTDTRLESSLINIQRLLNFAQQAQNHVFRLPEIAAAE